MAGALMVVASWLVFKMAEAEAEFLQAAKAWILRSPHKVPGSEVTSLEVQNRWDALVVRAMKKSIHYDGHFSCPRSRPNLPRQILQEVRGERNLKHKDI